jgi:hypothetical protein
MKTLFIFLFHLIIFFQASAESKAQSDFPDWNSVLAKASLSFQQNKVPKILSFRESNLDQFIVAELDSIRIEIDTAKNIAAIDADKRIKLEATLLNKLRTQRNTPYAGEIATQTTCTNLADTATIPITMGSTSVDLKFIGASSRFVLTNCKEELAYFTAITFFYDPKNRNINTIRVFKKRTKKIKDFTSSVKAELVTLITGFKPI